jgi:hypothetical protein
VTAVSAELGYFSSSAEGAEAKGGANRKDPRRRSEPRILHHTPLPQSNQQSLKSLLSLADAIKEQSPLLASAQMPPTQGNIPTVPKSRRQEALDRQVHLFCKTARLPWISRHGVPLRPQSFVKFPLVLQEALRKYPFWRNRTLAARLAGVYSVQQMRMVIQTGT